MRTIAGEVVDSQEGPEKLGKEFGAKLECIDPEKFSEDLGRMIRQRICITQGQSIVTNPDSYRSTDL